MSYVLTAYVVDIAKLKSVVGSKDGSLVEAIVESNPEAFEDEYEFDEEIVLSEALRQLVIGEEMDPEEAHQYGYAFREICAHCGELQHADWWNGVRWAAVEACGLEELLMKTGPSVALPRISDFPTIGHIRRDQVNDYLQAARKRAESEKDSDLQAMLNEYIGWLEAAASKNLDLVFFYH